MLQGHVGMRTTQDNPNHTRCPIITTNHNAIAIQKKGVTTSCARGGCHGDLESSPSPANERVSEKFKSVSRWTAEGVYHVYQGGRCLVIYGVLVSYVVNGRVVRQHRSTAAQCQDMGARKSTYK